jgi:DNA adenine methylase
MALSYIGGKSKIGTWVRNYIPKDIETYIEPFSGMYWVFFKMDIPSYTNLKKVVYNDLNPLNVNLFNCIREYDKFYNVIKNYQPQDRSLFVKSQEEIFSPTFKVNLSNPDFETASKYALVLSQVFSGTNPKKGGFIDLKGKYKSKFDSFREKLINPKWQKYFDKISVVENLDFEEVIKKYDGEKTYFYCDPPYFLTEKYYANHDFGIETHERLAKTLQKIDGRFSMSYYDFPQLSEWFSKNKYTWASKEFSKAAMAKSGKAQTKGVELLIMNYNMNNSLLETDDDSDDFKI